MTIRYHWIRLAAGIGVTSLALACSSLLDTNTLTSGGDGATHDVYVGDGKPENIIPPDLLPGDLGLCQSGKTCTVVGQKGLCAVGKSQCFEAGTGTCVQTVQPAAEKCDGKDGDCDGVADESDPQAHASCGTGKYCNKTVCAAGCYTKSQCTGSTDTCTNHVCLCGTKPACTPTSNPVCSAGVCLCDSDSTCKSPEKCTSGVCYCGTTAGLTAGPACTLGTCDPTSGQCVVATDAGPDLPPPDLGAPDLPPPDLPSTPDLPPDA